MKKLARILVPVDGSDGSGRAVALASDLAEIVGAALDILYVSYFDRETDAQEESWLPDSIAGPVGDKAQNILERAGEHVSTGVLADYHHRTGIPADEILRFAEDQSVELIVVGGRGLGVVEGFLLGSVSQAVVERAVTSVVVAK